jgi:hypothetical protein
MGYLYGKILKKKKNYYYHYNRRHHHYYCYYFAEYHGQVVNTPALYFGGPGFKSELGDHFFCFSIVLSGECQDSALTLGHKHFFQIFSNSSFTYFPFIQHYIASELLKKRH